MNFSYLQIGVMQAAAGFMTYLIIMGENGFHVRRLLWIRDEWDDPMVDDLEDSYGQQWVRLSFLNEFSSYIRKFTFFFNGTFAVDVQRTKRLGALLSRSFFLCNRCRTMG